MIAHRAYHDPRARIAARIIVVVVNIAIIVFALNGTMLLSALRLDHDRAWIKHSWDVMFTFRSVLQELVVAESAQRAYLISGSVEYMNEYYDAKNDAMRDLDSLATLVDDNPRQAARVATARRQLREKFAFLDRFMILRSMGLKAARDIDLKAGRRMILAIRATFADMDDEERTIFHARDAELTRTIYRIYIGLFVVLATELLALAVFVAALVRAAGRRRPHPGGTPS